MATFVRFKLAFLKKPGMKKSSTPVVALQLSAPCRERAKVVAA
jgi:hypothetical protein